MEKRILRAAAPDGVTCVSTGKQDTPWITPPAHGRPTARKKTFWGDPPACPLGTLGQNTAKRLCRGRRVGLVFSLKVGGIDFSVSMRSAPRGREYENHCGILGP